MAWRAAPPHTQSRRGALKMLSNLAIEMTAPLDIAIQQQISAGDLTSIAVYPPLFSQWDYCADMGQEYKNSDVQAVENPYLSDDFDESAATAEQLAAYQRAKQLFDQAWVISQKQHKSWDYALNYKLYQFQKPALAIPIPRGN